MSSSYVVEPTTRVELVTSSLPRTRSNQLSYVGSMDPVVYPSSVVQSSFFLVIRHDHQRVTPGAGDGVRTRDVQLGRLELYQLSYSRVSRCFRNSPR